MLSSHRISTPRCLVLCQILLVACLLAVTDGFNTRRRINQQHARSRNVVSPKYSPRELSLTRHLPNGVQSNCPSSGLFRQRISQNQWQQHHPAVRVHVGSPLKLQMITTESSNKVSNNSNNPFVKIWLWFRKLIAQLWSILKKPFQSKDKEEGKPVENVEPAKEAETEPVQEEVIITQIENLAAVEDERKSELSELLASAEEGTKFEPSKPQSPAPVAQKAKAAPTPPARASSSPRQATACSTVDLSGNWTLIVDDAFKTQYDEYLRRLGQPMLVRTVALTVIGSTKEETKQLEGGQQLFIKGTNVRGSWERTLEASETSISADGDTTEHAVEGHVLKPMVTADEEEVEVASWWEENGTVHKSWVVGGKKYGGGDFENRRYLTDNGNILVCESIFHPNEEGREKAYVKWRFLKEGAMYGEEPAHFPNPFEVFEKKGEVPPGEKEYASSKSGIVVGDIMDSVTTSDEVNIMSTSMDVEEYIDIEGWVPPIGERWAIAAPGVDLSGKWKLIITEQFKRDYDEFLKSLGQPIIVRGAAVVLVGNTREETKQMDGGRFLYIKGINAKGIWERTLTTSGSDFDTAMLPEPNGSYNHTQVPIVTADAERVLAESWWEHDGTVHVSWTLGVKKYGGGSFESKRYLENNGDVYVCESIFHPDDTEGREESQLTWRFLREGATIFVGK